MTPTMVLMDVSVCIEDGKLIAKFPDGTYETDPRARCIEQFVEDHRPEMDLHCTPYNPTIPAQDVLKLVWSADVHNPVIHEFEVTGPPDLLQELLQECDVPGSVA
jgi:hypothetical protein